MWASRRRLDGRAGPRPQAILQRDDAREPIAERDEQDAPALGLELTDARVGQRDADLLIQHQATPTHHEAVAVRRDACDPETRVRRRVADVVGADAAHAGGAHDGARVGVDAGRLGAGGEGQDALGLGGSHGLDRHESRVPPGVTVPRALSTATSVDAARSKARARPCT